MNNGINLVVKRIDPKQLKLQRQSRMFRLVGFGFLAVFTFLSVVLFIFLQTSPIQRLREQEEALSLSLNTQNEKIQSELFINSQLGYIDEVLKNRSDLPDVVNSFLSVLPSTVVVSSYQAANGFIEMSVLSSSLSDLETFFDKVTDLSQSGGIYGNVTISDITFATSGTYSFGITITEE